jgi:hypothetical protein
MAKLSEALKAGIKGFTDARKSGEYTAGGVKVSCPNCGNEVFKDHGPLAVAEWTGVGPGFPVCIKAALVCLNCGLIQWFGVAPKKVKTHQE